MTLAATGVDSAVPLGEDLIRRIAEDHPLPVNVVDFETGQLLYSSPAAVALFGYEWPTPEPRYAIDHYANPDDRTRMLKRLEADGEVRDLEVESKRADGTSFWVHLTLRLMTVNERRLVVSTFADITEAKTREAELRHTRETLEDAIESLSEGFALFNRNDELVMCNAQYRDFHRVSADIIRPGMTWTELMRADLEKGLFVDAIGREDDWLAERIEARKAVKRDMEYEQSDGRWIIGSNTRTRDGAIVVTLRDITDRKRRETEIRESRQMLEDAIESLPEGFVIWDEDDKLVMCNQRYREINKISEHVLKPGVTWREFVRAGAELGQYEDAIGRVDEWYENRIKTRQIGNVSLYKLSDGRWVRTSSHATRQGGRVATRLDVTEQQEMEEALRESEEMIRRILEACPLPLAMSRIETGEYIYISPANAEMLGIDLDEGPVHAIDTFANPDIRKPYIEWMRERGRVDNMEVQRIGADGKPFWASMSSRLIEYKGEEVLVSSLFDLTERKEMEDALRDSEAMIRRILEASPVPIAMFSIDGDLIYANPANLALFGRDFEAYKKAPQDRWVDQGLRVKCMAQLKRDREITDYLTEYKRADGSTFWASVSARLVDYQGEDVIVSTIFDLTERYAAEAEMERQREALYQSEKLNALGTLLAGVAHELNNPLSVVSGQALLLEETTADDRIRQRAAMIGDAADRCSSIVKTFLAMAREEPGEAAPVDLNEVVETALNVTGFALRNANITLTRRLSKTLKAVHGNADQLSQVVTNLIVNAQQALERMDPPRKLSITSRQDRKRGEVVLRVTDNGPGIPKENRRRVFEPFFTTKPVGEGTGIGLAVCHQIIESHGGTITIEDPRGGGTAFVVRLPAAAKRARPHTASDTPPQIRPCRVLVVDDEPGVAQLLRDVLENDGHAVTTAENVATATANLNDGAYDVIISDLRLPDSDGFGIFETLEAEHPVLLARTAFMTGDTMNERVRTFLKNAGRPYVEKPITPADVRDLVHRIITAARTNGNGHER